VHGCTWFLCPPPLNHLQVPNATPRSGSPVARCYRRADQRGLHRGEAASCSSCRLLAAAGPSRDGEAAATEPSRDLRPAGGGSGPTTPTSTNERCECDGAGESHPPPDGSLIPPRPRINHAGRAHTRAPAHTCASPVVNHRRPCQCQCARATRRQFACNPRFSFSISHHSSPVVYVYYTRVFPFPFFFLFSSCLFCIYKLLARARGGH
jgi:hypothetical protein